VPVDHGAVYADGTPLPGCMPPLIHAKEAGTSDMLQCNLSMLGFDAMATALKL
jgi:hypothetical protein